MDNPKEYILMCSKTKKIQLYYKNIQLHKSYWNVGDQYINIYDGDEEINICSFDSEYGESVKRDKDIWLPRQDQLQKMIIDKYGLEDMIGAFYHFSIAETYKIITNSSLNATVFFNSMEQLWLAFVMKVKYNKQWSIESKTWEAVNNG